MATLLAEGEEEFGGGDDLAGVALGVVGDMDEEAAYGGGELLTADGAGEFEVGAGQIANAGGGVIEGFVEFLQDRSNGDDRVGFSFQRSELRIGEVVAFGVGEEPIDATGDVTDVKGEGRQAVRLGVKVFLREAEAPVIDIFGCEVEGIKDGEVDCGQVFFSAAEPGLGIFRRNHAL